jgi:hypothetical protein
MSTRDTAHDAAGFARLDSRLHALVGLPWGVAYLSYGGELRAGLGGLVVSRRGYTRGEWTLGTRGSPWVLSAAGVPVASNQDDEATWVTSTDVLKGKVVKEVRLAMPGPDVVIDFEDHLRFSILPSRMADWQAWELLCPDGSLIVVWCDGHWTEQLRGEPSETE